MTKTWSVIGLLGIALTLNGCGGSSKGVAEEATNGTLALASYRATLPGGTPMIVTFATEKDGVYTGSFSHAAAEGEYAFQSGMVVANLSGSQLNAECVTPDGKTFGLTGEVRDGTLRLTRSDLAGQPLAFSRVPAPSKSRGEMSFFLDGHAGSKGRVVLSDVPNSVQSASGTTLSEYKGTWQGVPVTFWSYGTGYCNMIVYLDNLCAMSAVFSSYLPSDFPTKTAVAYTGYVTYYNSSLRTQLKFKTQPTVSP